MMEIRRDPTPRELAWFGLALLSFFGILGGILWWRLGTPVVTRWLWGFGVALVALYYAVPPWRRPIFVGWSTLTYPLGWLLSHFVLALVFYGLVTPIGSIRRVLGKDSMGREFDRECPTYWQERSPGPSLERYFRQF